MSSLFDKPDFPELPPPSPLPDDPSALAEERRRQRRLAAQREGRESTVATGSLGLTGPAPTARKRLLGD